MNLNMDNKTSLGERGQYFSGFRMLIGAIMALAILAIILGAIDYFRQLEVSSSNQQFLQGFSSAVEASDGSVIAKKNILLQPAEFGSVYFARLARTDPECVEFRSSGISNYTISPDGHGVRINNEIKTDIFFKCERFVLGCDVRCTISFGKKLT